MGRKEKDDEKKYEQPSADFPKEEDETNLVLTAWMFFWNKISHTILTPDEVVLLERSEVREVFLHRGPRNSMMRGQLFRRNRVL